jgi:hypothetical protein
MRSYDKYAEWFVPSIEPFLNFAAAATSAARAPKQF